ncbi:MAG: hypothetical protein BGO72_21395 [Burkholderiales bacterium 70-64]|nr:MAG: hypothetical protein BGO72_21395 [Burkholderiales bacterium 70-64]
MAGSVIGSMLFAPDAPDGPRIADKGVRAGAYGQMIPITAATVRVTADLLWFSDLIESSEEVGGKGGGGATQWHYAINMLVQACESPEGEPRTPLHIWANGRLLWSHDGTPDGVVDDQLIQRGNVRWYDGQDAQLPDPVYEAAVGIAPAHLGYLTIMLEELQLDFSGNRPPTIEVEVAEHIAGGATQSNVYTSGNFHNAGEPTTVRARGYLAVLRIASGDVRLRTIRESDGVLTGEITIPLSWSSIGGILFDPTSDTVWLRAGSAIRAYDMAGNQVVAATLPNTSADFAFSASGSLWVYSHAAYAWWRINKLNGAVLETRIVSTRFLSGNIAVGIANDGAILARYANKIYRHTGVGSDYDVIDLSIYYTGIKRSWYDAVRDEIVVLASNGASAVAARINPITGDIIGSRAFDATIYSTAETTGVVSYDPIGQCIWHAVRFGSIDRFDVLTGSMATAMYTFTPAAYLNQVIVLPSESGIFLAWNDTSLTDFTYARFGGAPRGLPISLAELVERTCIRSGMDPASIDTTELDDSIAGYSITRQSTGRAVIDQLRSAYFFDGVESGLSYAWRKRGKAPVATIDAGELGAHVFQSGSSDPPPAREAEMIPDVEAPAELTLSYVDAAANYDVGVSTARRQATQAGAPARIELPIVLSDAEAGAIVWANLLHAHAARNSLAIKLTHAYEHLEPSDAILVPFADGELRRMRIDKRTSARPLVELEGVIEDVSWVDVRYGGTGRGAAPAQVAPSMLSTSVLALLDLPPLRPEDDALVIYGAVAPARAADAWPGAAIYKSVDGGASYDSVLATRGRATLGATTTVLGDWSGGNRWDRADTVRVALTSGTFSSASELAVYNGANAVAIGDEIIQFANAVLVSPGEWELSTLLRGRIGTERAIAGHAVGDRVVLLSPALRALALPAGELGAARLYKAVTGGQPIADAPSQTFAAAGNSLRPLSPVRIRGSRSGGDLTITWVRRARLYRGWHVPLDEPVEAYEIDILSGSSVVRTLTASAPIVVYTAAQQTADFGAPQPEGTVPVAIHMISSRVGRGHAGTATL